MTPLDGPLSHAIGLAVLHLLWQGTLIAIVLAIALRLLVTSSANLRYAISCAALAAFVVFGVATAYRSYEPESSYLLVDDDAVARVGSNESAGGAPAAPQSGDESWSFLALVQQHSSTIALIWLAGVVALATRLTVAWTRARGLGSFGVTPARAEHRAALERLSSALGIRRSVRLLESVRVEVPSVVGFLKPIILVPASSLSGLSPRQLELILAHELAHIRRHDFLVNMLQSVAETLLFYHPAAWWVSRQIRIERENCCDDLAVATCGNALEYARALTLLEELRSDSGLAVAASGGSLLGRVKRLVRRGDASSVNGWTALAAAVSFAVVMTITSLPVHADLDVPAPPPPPAPPAAEIEVLAPDGELPALPAPPAPAPRARVAVTPIPRPARAPRPPVAVAVADPDFDDDIDIDLDIDDDLDDIDDEDDEQESTPRPDGRLSINELIALRIHGVTPAYISEMRGIFGRITIRQVTSLKTMGVSAKYVSDMRAAGVDITSARDAVTLKAQNVTPEFVRSLAAAGYTKLTVRELSRLAAAGVNADFIREMQKYKSQK